MSELNSENQDPHIHYSTDGKGRWWKVQHRLQCPEKIVLYGRCQGVEGHKGVHWSFSPNGSFCYDDNDQYSSEEGCAGITPPGHKEYRSPFEMEQHYYMTNSSCGEVIDKDEIDRLERGDIKSGETISRPVDFSKMSPERAAELRKRLQEDLIVDKCKPWWAFWRTNKPKIT